MPQGQSNDQNPFSIQKYLEGIDYPVSKDELYEHAEDNDAPDEVLEFLDGLDDQEYNSPVDVTKQVTARQQGSQGTQGGEQRPRA